MAFKVGNGWVSFNGHKIGTGETKALAKAVATVRSRFHKPLVTVGVASLLALSLMGCTPDGKRPESFADVYKATTCTEQMKLADRSNIIRCDVFEKMQKQAGVDPHTANNGR